MGDKIHAFSCGITNNDKVKENGCSVECLCNAGYAIGGSFGKSSDEINGGLVRFKKSAIETIN